MPKKQQLMQFVDWYQTYCSGYEKGEAQIFIDHLFQACGHPGILDIGGNLEFRIRKNSSVSFADLVWKPKVLIEMKKKGSDLSKHYDQAFDYWLYLVPNRPQYVILCNFDELWIYDFNLQMEQPLDRVSVKDLPDHWGSIAFLFPDDPPPVFRNNLIEVTASAADSVASLFKSLQGRGLYIEQAQRFALQCVMAMFAEDIDLLPKYLFTQLVN